MSEFWYCVKHHAVEHGDGMCPSIDRLGPYPSKQDAERALEIAEQRNQEWDEQDKEDDED
jgi:hypothetical protein